MNIGEMMKIVCNNGISGRRVAKTDAVYSETHDAPLLTGQVAIDIRQSWPNGGVENSVQTGIKS